MSDLAEIVGFVASTTFCRREYILFEYAVSAEFSMPRVRIDLRFLSPHGVSVSALLVQCEQRWDNKHTGKTREKAENDLVRGPLSTVHASVHSPRSTVHGPRYAVEGRGFVLTLDFCA